MTPSEKAVATRRKHREAWRAKERQRKAQSEAVRAALLELVQDPTLSASERLRAAEALQKRFLS